MPCDCQAPSQWLVLYLRALSTTPCQQGAWKETAHAVGRHEDAREGQPRHHLQYISGCPTIFLRRSHAGHAEPLFHPRD